VGGRQQPRLPFGSSRCPAAGPVRAAGGACAAPPCAAPAERAAAPRRRSKPLLPESCAWQPAPDSAQLPPGQLLPPQPPQPPQHAGQGQLLSGSLHSSADASLQNWINSISSSQRLAGPVPSWQLEPCPFCPAHNGQPPEVFLDPLSHRVGPPGAAPCSCLPSRPGRPRGTPPLEARPPPAAATPARRPCTPPAAAPTTRPKARRDAPAPCAPRRRAQVFQDPVIAMDGLTYEKEELLRFWQAHPGQSPLLRDPATGEGLRIEMMVVANHLVGGPAAGCWRGARGRGSGGGGGDGACRCALPAAEQRRALARRRHLPTPAPAPAPAGRAGQVHGGRVALLGQRPAAGARVAARILRRAAAQQQPHARQLQVLIVQEVW
jgi:hypothetical protein